MLREGLREGIVTFVTPYPFVESFVETSLIPRIRNRKTVFIEYQKSLCNPAKPLMVRGIVTLVTLYLSYTDAGTQTRGARSESLLSLLSLRLAFQRVTG